MCTQGVRLALVTPVDGDAHVPLKQLSQLTGLSPVLIRAWERRYGFPAPARTVGGHRRYTGREVEMVRHAALLVRSGLRAADAIARARARVPLPDRVGAISAAQLTELLLASDTTGALEYLRGASVATDFEATLGEIVLPALNEIGDGWASGRLSVADEHVATGVVMSWLGVVRAELPRLDLGPPVYVIAAPEGEDHGVAVWALELLLHMRRTPARALGTSVPVADLLVEAGRPDVLGLVLAITRTDLKPALMRVARSLAASVGGSCRLYTGGPGAVPPLPDGVILLPGTLGEAADRLADDAEASTT
jgi:MerR family transcriptional regulator, light-induced transcriptional regulator